MAVATKPRSTRKQPDAAPRPRVLRRVWRWVLRGLIAVAALYGLLILLFSFLPPPINFYQLGESWRLGSIEKDWTPWDEIAPVMGRSVVAAEDANFCLHWGFDMAAIRLAVAEGGARGASTLSQQVVKNVFLWQGRSWLRKAMEAAMTPLVELVWSKQRILEVYLNVAEFDEGVFGVQAAAARLAAALPDPKDRNPAAPSSFLRKRASQIIAGAETIAADGRSACFETRD
jgi:monofunctional biosynthetic peptidoglycan transglycosylase